MQEPSQTVSSSSSSVVQVHLIIHQPNENLRIDFPFDTIHDNIDNVVSELIETLGLTESDKGTIKNLIEQQINPHQKASAKILSDFEPIKLPNEQANDAYNDSSDDSDIKDEEYTALLEHQQQEMRQLLQKHYEERKELAQRVLNCQSVSLQNVNGDGTNSTNINSSNQMNFNLGSNNNSSNYIASNANTNNITTSNNNNIGDDLIVFS